MKVAISQSALSSASRTRGVGAYTRELIEALQRVYPGDKYSAVQGDPYQEDVDIVHFPFFDPFFLTLPLYQSKPTVVTIHDAIPLKYPKHFPVGIKGSLKWQLQRLAARRTSHIITDSHASKKDIIHVFGVEADQVIVVPLAPATDRGTVVIEDKVKKEYNLPVRYLLYVGDINWNKNIPGLIRMFDELKSSNTHLVLVGKVFSDKPQIPEYLRIQSAISASTHHELIHTVGYVPSHHLSTIYRLATLYVQPSFDEGFGLPILEAMKERCPIAASTRGSLKEVGGTAVAYFDPDKPQEMVRVVKELLGSKAKRDHLGELGAKRVKQFSWDKTARLTRDVYEKILG